MGTITIPESLKAAAEKLSPDDELGVWRIDPALMETADLQPGGPVNLYVIGEDGMGDFLCLQPSKFADGGAPPVAMWNPEARQTTILGESFEDFLEKEPHRRLSFLLEHVGPLTEAQVESARRGEPCALDGVEEDKRIFVEMICDLCRVGGKLGLGPSLFERAAGKSGPPSFLREVDGGDESEIDKALSELNRAAEAGDGAAALEISAFHQVRQKDEEAARFAYKLHKCALFTWPGFSPAMLGRVVELVKRNAAAIEAKERLDPLFGFLTSQPAHKPEQRLNLAKQYLRKKDFASAAREGENALKLSAVEPAALRPAYDFLLEVFRAAGRPNEAAYVERMISKLSALS
jgi:hypothetical protein